MLRKARSAAFLSALIFSTGSAYANNFNYNSYHFAVGGGPTTFGAGMTMRFMENAHFVAEADSKFEGDYDIAAGVGFNGPLGQFADMTGQMLIHNIKEDSEKVLGEDVLPEVNLGGRIWFMDGIELHGKLGKLLDGDDSHTVWEIGGRFHSTQQLVLGASLMNGGVYGNQFVMRASFQY